MPEIIFGGADGRLEGRYQHGVGSKPPTALILHPNPQQGGTMNNKIVFNLYQQFVTRGFSTLRFNFRGVGRSQGLFDQGVGELHDAAAALDWLQQHNPNSNRCWVAGFQFGSWISMQLLMRRPEIEGFICAALPANMYDFTFLAPCPCSGLIVHGERDAIVPIDPVKKLIDKLHQQRGIAIEHDIVPGADHFFTDHMTAFNTSVDAYLKRSLPAKEAAENERAVA